ncbi:glycoside hydrolase family 10 protein [Burkholderia pseudomallei]|uniref:glycoside hydrolase family 10 protein n=1 Tax=Burkholderia pseudomallei TaxID=28450 RepID=UPI0021F703A3|nr:family 10 glycosylhydrolase [Burkholderia pseudomallei]MCW0022472.1 family 10 glycosylhydrolase [Burkholderia pseudomallei]MCW0081155.1 family 10 glycosylhydrolase [Burkholderia pseudomallei]MCW0154967.1 family 10 glycosylhydrolase [Burkholderia pseudomallei]MCW0167493.1 family 10 glycosylhydrolase [Burkholderia pseudomallei]
MLSTRLRHLAAAALVLSASACASSPQAVPEVACRPDETMPKRQFRGTWIASVINLDWPSRPGLPAAAQQAELSAWLDDAVRMNRNAVILQVRPTADAFWPSPFEPWSKYLTGAQGGDPGYDPLAFAVAEAHRRNLELHAWFNPYRVAMDDRLDALVATHPARAHPDWVVRYGGKLYYNPGVPAARAFVVDAIMDAAARYDIDAVHLDDYFYPYPVAGATFDDASAYAQYGTGFATLADWRRDNVDRLVESLAQRIKAAKPWVKFGISPFAVWRNAATDPQGSRTSASVQTYDDLYADTRRWVRERWIDYVVPQAYWARGFAPADYDEVVAWWANEVRGRDAHLYIGQAAYKVGTSNQSPGWSDPDELSRHLAFNLTAPEVKGDVYFSAKDVRADRLGATTRLNRTWYSRPALVPTMPALGGNAPPSAKALRAQRTPDGVRLQWQAGSAAAASYAVYRHALGRQDMCADSDARHLLATVRGTQYVDVTARADRDYRYVVTALDRLWHESEPAYVAMPAAKPR